jgi:TolB-like protein
LLTDYLILLNYLYALDGLNRRIFVFSCFFPKNKARGELKMIEGAVKSMRIDLNQFKLHLCLKPGVELTLHFDSPSRRFYLSVIGLVVHEMKKRGRITTIPLQDYLDVLILLNQTVGAAAGSSQKEHLLPRIYRKWKDALPDLEKAPLFKVVGRKKRYDESMDKVYGFSEGEKDAWANLFEYKGSQENVRLKFAIERLGNNLDDVSIVCGEYPQLADEDAWERFVENLAQKRKDPSRIDSSMDESRALDSLPVHLSKWVRAMPKWVQWTSLFALVVLVLGAAAFVAWKYNLLFTQVEDSAAGRTTSPLQEKISIAVLPFVNMSGDPEQEYFTDGICDDLITDLSKIPDLMVTSRNSAFMYKGKSVKTHKIAEELGVRYILEGSVRKADNRIRITAQLVDTKTGHHLWAERYDENIRSIFSIQDKITREIVTALAVKLTENEQRIIVHKETDNIEAYDAYLKGSSLTMRMDPENYAAAIPWFEKAIELDPNYSRAYAALAETYFFGTYMGLERILGISYRLARIRRNNYLREAMKNPTNIAHRGVAFNYAYQRQFEKALDHAMRAFAFNPNDAKSNQTITLMLTFLGRFDEAINFAERSSKVDPDCYH